MYDVGLPDDKNIWRWYEQFRETGSAEKTQSNQKA